MQNYSQLLKMKKLEHHANIYFTDHITICDIVVISAKYLVHLSHSNYLHEIFLLRELNICLRFSFLVLQVTI